MPIQMWPQPLGRKPKAPRHGTHKSFLLHIGDDMVGMVRFWFQCMSDCPVKIDEPFVVGDDQRLQPIHMRHCTTRASAQQGNDPEQVLNAGKMAGSRWATQEEVAKRCLEKVTAQEHADFVALLERLVSLPFSYR